MNIALPAAMALTTVVLFVLSLLINEAIFQNSEFLPGVNWIYLPAGMRLVCTLLFGEAGAIGLLLASWLVSFLYFFPHDFQRAFIGGIIATAAPYAVYRFAQTRMHLRNSLANLTPRRLLLCAVLYSIASPLLHHAWFVAQGRTDLLKSLVVMTVGDLSGTLLLLYGAKVVLRGLHKVGEKSKIKN